MSTRTSDKWNVCELECGCISVAESNNDAESNQGEIE